MQPITAQSRDKQTRAGNLSVGPPFASPSVCVHTLWGSVLVTPPPRGDPLLSSVVHQLEMKRLSRQYIPTYSSSRHLAPMERCWPTGWEAEKKRDPHAHLAHAHAATHRHRCFLTKWYMVWKRGRRLDVEDWQRSLCVRSFHCATLSMESGTNVLRTAGYLMKHTLLTSRLCRLGGSLCWIAIYFNFPLRRDGTQGS